MVVSQDPNDKEGLVMGNGMKMLSEMVPHLRITALARSPNPWIVCLCACDYEPRTITSLLETIGLNDPNKSAKAL